jgi:hypothetical protein
MVASYSPWVLELDSESKLSPRHVTTLPWINSDARETRVGWGGRSIDGLVALALCLCATVPEVEFHHLCCGLVALAFGHDQVFLAVCAWAISNAAICNEDARKTNDGENHVGLDIGLKSVLNFVGLVTRNTKLRALIPVKDTNSDEREGTDLSKSPLQLTSIATNWRYHCPDQSRDYRGSIPPA